MYTPAQAAEALQIATSTLRKYSRLFTDHLSLQSNRQHRRYTERDISILQQIIQLREQGVALEAINQQLSAVQPDGEPESNTQDISFLTSPDGTYQDTTDLRQSVEDIREQYHSLAEKIRQDNRQFEETISRLEEETRRTRHELEIIKEENVSEQSQLKQDLQIELQKILADIQNTRQEMEETQSNSPAPAPAATEDVSTEMMQIRAEIYRLKEAQKRTEQRIKALSDRVDAPFWRRGPKNPLDA